jgi:hypothetical protein
MDIKLIPATEASILEMCDCGGRAFENNALDHAIFPTCAQDPAKANDIYNFRVERMRKQIQSPEWLYVLATASIDGQAKILGYAGFLSPPQEQGKAKSNAENEVESQANALDAETFHKGMDMEAYKYATEILEKAKKDILGEGGNMVWCKL